MPVAEELRECADAVSRACASLVEATPAALEDCAETLAAAARRLAGLGPALDGVSGSADALAEGWRLRRNLAIAGKLLGNVAAYHGGWCDRLAAQVAGYAPGGRPAALTRAGRIWVEA
jgi:hypothetical protein